MEIYITCEEWKFVIDTLSCVKPERLIEKIVYERDKNHYTGCFKSCWLFVDRFNSFETYGGERSISHALLLFINNNDVEIWTQAVWPKILTLAIIIFKKGNYLITWQWMEKLRKTINLYGARLKALLIFLNISVLFLDYVWLLDLFLVKLFTAVFS